MASKINSRANLLSMFHDMRIKGPVLEGEVYDSQFKVTMDTIEFSVSNHSKLPDPLPFGVFGEIVNERNSNQAWVKLRICKEFWDIVEGEPKGRFAQRSGYKFRPNEIVCAFIETTYLVSQSEYVPFATYGDAYLWEEEFISLSTETLFVTELSVVWPTGGINQYDDGPGSFNEELKTFVKTKKELVNIYTDPGLVVNAGQTLASYSYCVSVKCGWWLKYTEEFTLVGGEINYSYNTVVDHSFPPVLSSLPLYVWETKDGAARYYPQEVWLRSAFSGPCQATVTVKWKPTAITAPTITQIKPTSVSYNCPFFSINTGPCLHGLLEPHANIGTDDPDWAFQDGSELTIVATTPTDWPDTLVTDAPVTPYKGGYLMKTVTVTAPK